MSNSGKVTLENSIKGDIDLELGGKTEQVQTTGKNLANPSEFVIGTLAGDTGNIINLKQYITTGYIPVIPGKRYSTSCGNKFSAHTIIAYDKDKAKINSQLNMSSEMPEGAAYIRSSYKKIDMTNVTESDMEELKKVCMVNEGSTALPYEPYTGGKPSPSPEYPQEIKNSGKWNEEKQKYEVTVKINNANLLNEEDFFDMGNWKSYQYHMDLAPNTKYTFSRKDNSGINSGLFLSIKETAEGTWSQIINSNSASSCKQKVTFTTNESGKIYFLIQNNKSVNLKDFLGYAQLEVGTIATQHMKYTEQPLTLTSDRPITKWDRLVEQGGEYGWLYGGDIKTFENDVFKLYADNEKAIQYQVPFEEISNSWSELVCYCNTFENAIGQTIYTQSGKTDFYMGCVHKSMVFSAKNKQGIFQSIEAFQEWIRNSGTYVWYKTDNKKFVPLSESEQTQLRNLHSYNGTTHITADSGEVPCGIKVAYKQKK